MATHQDTLQTALFSFIDSHGRRIHLRGVNLSGSSKAPLAQPSHVLSQFWETAERGGESFLGQPLNLDDGSADQHLARLRGWGFNLLRFPVTWESLEHAGPKKYDYEYMDYLIRILRKCKQYGFRVYIDPHQDTWSRFSGGSGAPFWTLPACGINPYNLSATQAALIHSEWPLPHTADPASFPAMIWGTNYGRLLSLTLFTLFFAGRAFAPNCIIDDMNIQDYLQTHYINAFGEFAERIRKADEEADEEDQLLDACIIGWDSLNEPAEGFVGWDDLNANPTEQGTTLKKGTHPSPAQSLRLGMGQTQTVETWDFGSFGPKRTGTSTINPKGRKIWAEPNDAPPPPPSPTSSTEGSSSSSSPPLEGERPDGTHPRWGWKRNVEKWPLGKCIWALHGVWDIESGFILRPDYFKYNPSTGIEVDFLADFWVPHFTAYTQRIRSFHPNSIAFIQPPVFALPPHVGEEVLHGRCAYTGHYYDGLTLITKHWNWFNADSLGVLRGKYKSPIMAVKFGEKAIRKSIMEQIRWIKADAELITSSTHLPHTVPSSPLSTKVHQYPTVIGEIGTPFDMDSKSSYYSKKNKGDYTNQEKALDASLNACDGYNNVNYTTWTYLARGHTHEWGDGWNGEDLSLWSQEDMRQVGGEDGEVKRKDLVAKSESRAGLLSPVGSKNVSMLSLNTLSSNAPSPTTRKHSEGEEDEESTLPNASTPTLLLSKKPSGAFSIKTAVVENDEDNSPESPSLPRPTISITTDTTTTISSDQDRHTTKTTSTFHIEDSNIEADRDPYDFLTNGARAFRAFCRPRPVKVYGEVLDTMFDIGKAELKCVIRVPSLSSTSTATTASLPGITTTTTTSNTRSGDEAEQEDDEELATEIYLPLVHFASSEILEESKARWDQRRTNIKMDPPKTYGWNTSSSSEDGEEKVMKNRRRVLQGIEDRTDLLDVEVKVSVGKWKIRGQRLYWWYPHPHSVGAPRSQDDEQQKDGEEVVIEVKRRGGAIKVRKGGWIDSKSWQRTKEDPGRRKTWLERLCGFDFGCIIM